MSTRWRIAETRPNSCFVPCLMTYCLPGTNGSSDIQTSCASKRSSTHGRLPGFDEHVAAADVDFARQRQRDRKWRKCFVEITVHRDDARNRRGLAGRQHDDLIAGPNDAALHGAAVAAERRIGPVDALHREAEVVEVAIRRDLHVLQQVHQGAALVPRHLRRIFRRRCRRATRRSE